MGERMLDMAGFESAEERQVVNEESDLRAGFPWALGVRVPGIPPATLRRRLVLVRGGFLRACAD